MDSTAADHWEDHFQAEFAKETDRSVAIIAAALLEQALESLLRGHMVPCGSQDDTLFDGAYAPLGTFSAKIDLAYRLGLVNARICRDLHLVRKIRNDFAHNVTGCSFDDASVRARILEITRSQGVAKGNPHMRSVYPEGPKGDYGITVSWMLWSLWVDAEAVGQLVALHDSPPWPHDGDQ